MLAALPMYDWPETRTGTDAWWRRFRDLVGDAAPLPEALSRPADEAALHALWRDPELIFAQTCWGPLKAGLLDHITVLAQPDFSPVEGGRGPWYRSAVIARRGEAATIPEGPESRLPVAAMAGTRLAYNGPGSLSGYLALAEDLAPETPENLFAEQILTGGHRASVASVAEGRADYAAIDCLSWSLALAHEPGARDLVTVGWTGERPGLPYICARGVEETTVRALRAALYRMGCHPVTGTRSTPSS